jgi:hypothetical protein
MERDKELPGIKWLERDEKRLVAQRERVERIRKRRRDREPVRAPEATPEQRKRERAEAELNGHNDSSRLGGPFYGEWINAQGALAMFQEKRAELPKGDLAAALAKLEKRQAAIADRFVELKSAPVDVQTAVDAMKAQVADMAVDGRPKLDDLVLYRERGFARTLGVGKAEFAEQPIFFKDDSAVIVEMGNSTLAWLFEEEIIAKLEKEIRARYAGVAGVSVEARYQEEAALRAEWLDNQRIIVRIAEERGEPLPAVHPLALFSIERAGQRPLTFVEHPKATPGQSATIGLPIAARGGK